MPFKVPEGFLKLDPNQPPVVTREAPIHYNDVRLVVPVLDPATNTLKDTIVANIEMSRIFHDKREGKKLWTRYIKGTRTEIPWPEKKEPEHFDQIGDTRIMDVETRTYVPTLLKPPFPLSVIDELRNKYSKFRTRHEPWYIAKVEAAEKEKAEKEGRKILTPLQLLNKKIREEKKAKGPPVLSVEMMEHIGKVMAQNRPELLEKVKETTA
jgi:large subunit ribosomal protein L24